MPGQGYYGTGQNGGNKADASAIGTLVQVGAVLGDMHLHRQPDVPGFIQPRQLPAPPAVFIGRRAELDSLTRTLGNGQADTAVVWAVGGTGGVGKTSLVLHWAHRHVDRFPDGQLYVDLRGFSPTKEPMPSSVAVRGFLSALGVAPVAIPVDDDAQAALFRSLTAGKRILIVLDNVASTEQVRPLLPGSPTCTVLITSRCRLTGLIDTHGAGHLALDVLSPGDARALLAARIGTMRLTQEPQATADLMALCGGLPLALSVVAGRAAGHPHLRLSTVVAELVGTPGLRALDDGDTTSTPASVTAVLSWSYHALTPDQARAFGLLGIAPGPDISISAAASLTGMPVHQIRTVLRELERVSLVAEHATRYRMHDLVRDCARDHAGQDLAADDQDSALYRVIDFYTHTAHRGHLLLEPHDTYIALRPPAPGCSSLSLTSRRAAVEWFDTEHPCLLDAQYKAARGHHIGAAWQLAWGVSAYHHLRGLLGDNHRLWLEAEAAAGVWPDPVVDTMVQRHLGVAYLRMGHFDQANDHLYRALSLARDTGDLSSQARIHRSVSVMFEHLGDSQTALAHATRALELFQEAADPVWEADTLNTVGWCLALLGQYEKARQHCHVAFPVLRRYHPPGAADVLDTLGYIAYHMGHHADALGYLWQALALYRDLDDLYHVPDTLDRTGHALVVLNRTDDALAAWTEARTIYHTQGRVADEQRVQRKIDRPESHLIDSSWPYRRR